MVAVVDHGIHRYPALGGNDHFEPKASLRLEQRHAVEDDTCVPRFCNQSARCGRDREDRYVAGD